MDPSFEVQASSDVPAGETLLVGLSNPGMAGLTAVDHLLADRESAAVGHVTAHGFPSVTPFRDGEPRHHTRVYDVTGEDLSVLTSELFLTQNASEAFADGVLDWIVSAGFEEVVVLDGVPFVHGPEEHEVFHVSTPAFRDRRIEGSDVRALNGGFLDGVVGELLSMSLGGTAPPTGVFVTPTHPPGPDLEAAIRFLEALATVYDVPVDAGELKARAEELNRYYAEMAQRAQDIENDSDYPEDRAYM